MIEVEVHQQLRAFLKSQGEQPWLHHLTLGRLVARALRLRRSALIQAGSAVGTGQHRLSYLAPVLLWSDPVVIVTPHAVQQRLLQVEIPRLGAWLHQMGRPLRPIYRLEADGLEAIAPLLAAPASSPALLTTPEVWLRDRLTDPHSPLGQCLAILDGADDLERWARQVLTQRRSPQDWNALMWARPDAVEMIRDLRVQLTHAIFQHPVGPYPYCTLEAPERAALAITLGQLRRHPLGLPPGWDAFETLPPDGLLWAEVDRPTGQFTLAAAPVDVATPLRSLWQHQPVVAIGSFLDLDTDFSTYRERTGLDAAPDGDGPLTCLKLTPDRQQESLPLYLPERVPLPNTPQYQTALMQEIYALLAWVRSSPVPGLTVLLIGDVPLQGQVAAQLAAEFGSRVRVEQTALDEQGILVCGWAFWREHQAMLPTPALLAIAALPIPSLEDPLVAGQVAYYKRQRRDWFRLYLLPVALSELQRAIAPLRRAEPRQSGDRRSLVALLDSRVVHRSYGTQVLAALSPCDRTSYLDADWL